MFGTFAVTVGFFAFAMMMMAVGVVLQGKRLSGSCGGLGGEACKCSPEKQKACKSKAGEGELFSERAEEAMDPVAPRDEDEQWGRPGEERLIQLGLHGGDRSVTR